MKATENDSIFNMIRLTHMSTTHTDLTVLRSSARGVENLPGNNGEAMSHGLVFAFGRLAHHLVARRFPTSEYLCFQRAETIREQFVHLLPSLCKNSVLLTDA